MIRLKRAGRGSRHDSCAALVGEQLGLADLKPTTVYPPGSPRAAGRCIPLG